MDNEAIEVFAPAKINLALHVIGRRADGYHLMDMLVAFADAGDRISVRPADADRFEIGGRFAAAIPPGPDNLVLRARDALRTAAMGANCPPVAIRLEKNLPPSSGMGGGSSDAAATLKALAGLWDLGAVDLSVPAKALGADVPMCVAARPLRARGIGDELEPLGEFPSTPAVLVNPGVEVPTPSVFRALERKDNDPLPPPPGMRTAADVASFVVTTRNDLQAPAIGVSPAIAQVLSALGKTRPLAFRMTGSGATCFGLYASQQEAADAATGLRAQHPDWFIVATTLA